MKSRRLGWVVLTFYTATAVGAPMGSDIGIFRSGDAAGEKGKRALTILEGRLHRWLENQKGSLSVKRADLTVDPTLIQNERARGELSRELKAFEEAGPEGRWARLDLLASARAAVGEDRASGDLIARSLAWESLALWRQGEKARSARLLDKTLRLSPTGELYPAPWEREAPAEWVSLSRQKLARLKRDCLVDLPEGARSRRVNGFGVEPSAQLALFSGASYDVEWSRGSGELGRSHFTCRRPGRLALEEKDPAAPTLRDLGERHGMDNLALIEPHKGAFRVYLYSRVAGLEEVPMERPITISEVLASPLAAELPVNEARFEKLVGSQGWAPGTRVASNALWDGSLRAESRESAPRWYNKWTTWAVAGGVLAGILVTYFATRPAGQVQTQAHGGLRFPID
jgi:hypothetical protein